MAFHPKNNPVAMWLITSYVTATREVGINLVSCNARPVNFYSTAAWNLSQQYLFNYDVQLPSNHAISKTWLYLVSTLIISNKHAAYISYTCRKATKTIGGSYGGVRNIRPLSVQFLLCPFSSLPPVWEILDPSLKLIETSFSYFLWWNYKNYEKKFLCEAFKS